MKISEIMEVTPTSNTGQTRPPMKYKQSGVGGGRGSIYSKSTSDDGMKTVSSQVTGQTRTSGAMGTTTTNRAGQTIQKQTPRFAGLQQTTNIDPATGKETTSTNYRGKVGGAKVNVTTPGTIDQFDLKKATQQQVTTGGVTATKNQDGATVDMQMGANKLRMNSKKPGQTTITRKVPGQTTQQTTIPTSQLTGQKR